MVKAHSLLYAVYICLIVSIICGAILYFASLYNQLNLFYNTRENLYIQNQSYVNFALENLDENNTFYQDEVTGIQSFYENKSYGILNILHVKTFTKFDTIASVHLTGSFSNEKTCLLIANQGEPFYYSGKVKLIGDKKLSTLRIQEKYIKNEQNLLTANGTLELAQPHLPKFNPALKDFFKQDVSYRFQLKDIERKGDSIYFNSFKNETIGIQFSGTVLENITIKGNFILYAKDSVFIKNTAVLEDVIIRSPKIMVEEDFKGSLQLFASDKIEVGKTAQICYPSVLCLYGDSSEKRVVKVNEGASIYGAVILIEEYDSKQEENIMILKKEAVVIGEIYCMGKLMIEGKLYGTAYTNKVFYATETSHYDNCMVNSEIDISKKPHFFVSVPILEPKNKRNNGVFKKVL